MLMKNNEGGRRTICLGLAILMKNNDGARPNLMSRFSYANEEQ